IQREQEKSIVSIRIDHGNKFDNALFEEFDSLEGILHEFSTTTTPQQNRMVERKNRTLQKIAL
ncbi:hypothetical protein Csa_011653, partial [Cucumis sativus]